MKFIFGMQMHIEVFHKLVLSFWVCTTRHAQSTQNKFECLFNISKKAWKVKLIFCLQMDTKVFYKLIVSALGLYSQGCPKYPKKEVYNIFVISQGKHEG